MTSTAAELYLDLMKRVVTNTIYRDPDIDPERFFTLASQQAADPRKLLDDPAVWRPFDPDYRGQGRGWPRDAHTMVGDKRLDNLRACVERVLADGVPGDLMETGVWRGGSCIFMRAMLAAYEVSDRKVWVADSFEGIPAPDPTRHPADASAEGIDLVNVVVGVSLDTVRENFRRYGLLDEQVEFLEGRFCDTLPTAPVERLAVLRLDGDLYESTMDGLVNLYPKLSVGGFLIVDDYYALDTCAKAVDDYRAAQGIEAPVNQVDWTGVYWRKDG
jgi:hypothetical protein